MTTPIPVPSAGSIVAVGCESTYGTQAATTWQVPVKAPHVMPKPTWLDDKGLRGYPVMIYDEIAGVIATEYEMESNFYADTFPNFILNTLGGSDTVTGAGPYVHSLGLKEISPFQPPSMSITDWDGYNSYALVGGVMDTLKCSYQADQEASWTAHWIGGNIPLSGTTKPTPTNAVSTQAMAPGWDLAVSVGGSSINYVEKFELSISRTAKAIYTNGQQAPVVVFSNAIDVTGTIDCLVGSNADPFTSGTTPYATTRQASPLVVLATLTDPATGYYMKFQMSNVQFKEPDRNRSKDYISYTANYTAIGNTHDTGAGWSPVTFVASNGQSAAYAGS